MLNTIIKSILVLVAYWQCVYTASDQFQDIGEDFTPSRYEVLQFKFAQVTEVYAITLWILLGCLTKIGLTN